MPTPEFEENIQLLIEETERAAVAIMCAKPHALTPWARLDGGHVTYPGLLGGG